MISRIDSVAHQNALRFLSPQFKVMFGIGMLITVLFVTMRVQWLIFIWMSLWILYYAKVPLRFYLYLTGASLLFFVASLPALMLEIEWYKQDGLIKAVSRGWTLIDTMGYRVYFDSKNAILVSQLLSRTLAATVCMAFLLLTTPIHQIIQVLRKWHIPEIILDLMMLMYRFLFILFATAREVWIAQKMRGGHGNMAARVKDTGRLVAMLFQKSMRRYQQMNIGLQCRGYDGQLRVISMEQSMKSRRYLLEAVCGMVIAVLLTVFSLMM
ncbi:cobalt ECF transporter T component CbiQ [Brevibacillus daliensis]|uniref:cobalt ECF transporter T component CbiQ n=1 Tax=Brevibacillus daliensis TaxID=2892995 RepID=UPI001E4D0A33|nr:cobalt ECF transporter T component CbiQ [Brevibacillus daliensis]